ncbi:hypothetical protein Pla52o_37670 [Novipirellula galeiformis]|uniref:Uncharacterized protein n=1 Tax=Novipirellula galeiformis TaxID=2528004 RepID=A0A5C6CAH4_9BACT|nr:hypothetical protein Pla52o_37670 [Novipirellula galeiformis]
MHSKRIRWKNDLPDIVFAGITPLPEKRLRRKNASRGKALIIGHTKAKKLAIDSRSSLGQGWFRHAHPRRVCEWRRLIDQATRIAWRRNDQGKYDEIPLL